MREFTGKETLNIGFGTNPIQIRQGDKFDVTYNNGQGGNTYVVIFKETVTPITLATYDKILRLSKSL